MPGTDLIPLDNAGVTVAAPLSLRYEEWPGGEVLSVIVTGPLGAVELQIRPRLLSWPGGGMSVEYHSHKPMPGADTRMKDCSVLGGTCYSDGISGATQAFFEPLFRAGDAEAIVAELARRYTLSTWSYEATDTAAAADGADVGGSEATS